MQNKPNFRKAKMNVTSVKTMNYEQLTMNYYAKQTQFTGRSNERKFFYNKVL